MFSWTRMSTCLILVILDILSIIFEKINIELVFIYKFGKRDSQQWITPLKQDISISKVTGIRDYETKMTLTAILLHFYCKIILISDCGKMCIKKKTIEKMK